MNLSERILTTVASLPESKQAEVLDFVERLKLKRKKKKIVIGMAFLLPPQ